VFIGLVIVAMIYICSVILSGSLEGGSWYRGFPIIAPDGVVLTGKILYFNWSGTQKVSVAWSAFRFLPYDLDPWNDAYIYINKWVQIWHFPYLEATQRRITIAAH